MNTRHATRTHRPIKGLVAFVRAEAMGSLGACYVALHQVRPMSCRFEPSMGGWQLDRDQGRTHPGEGSA